MEQEAKYGNVTRQDEKVKKIQWLRVDEIEEKIEAEMRQKKKALH